jgi:hypothetical protein
MVIVVPVRTGDTADAKYQKRRRADGLHWRYVKAIRRSDDFDVRHPVEMRFRQFSVPYGSRPF